MFKPPIQPLRAPSRRPKFADMLTFDMDFSSEMQYSTKLPISSSLMELSLTTMSPPLANIIAYFAFKEPNQPLPICLIARISGDNSSMLNASFSIRSPDTDV